MSKNFFKCLLAFAVIIPSANAQSQNSAEIADTIACLSIEDDSERLSCLETAATALKSTQIIREAADKEATGNQATEFNSTANNDLDDSFGAESVRQKRVDRDKSRPNTLEAQIAQIKIRKNNRVTFTLTNGQVWQQLNSDSHRIIFPKKKKEKIYTARIRRTSFGGYFLKVKEKNQSIRVRRIK